MECLPEPRPDREMEKMQELWGDIRVLLRQFPAESFIPKQERDDDEA